METARTLKSGPFFFWCEKRLTSKAFSVWMIAVEMGICGLPPLNQRTIQGWGTQAFVST
jgi:hypothetical protein